MHNKVLNIFGKDNQIELITSEERSTYAKCKILGKYDAIFEVLSKRINLKYLKSRGIGVAELGGLTINIDNDLRAMHLVFKDLASQSVRRNFSISQFNTLIYQDTPSGNFRKHILDKRVVIHYTRLGLMLIVDDRNVLAGYALDSNIKYVSTVDNLIKITTVSYSCYIDSKTYEIVELKRGIFYGDSRTR